MRYRLLLIYGSIICALWLLRCLVAGTLAFYGFIPWNIFLAVIPLLIESAFIWIKKFGGLVSKAGRLFLAFVWLMFLPNAFYILTDFMHLNSRVLVNVRGDNHHRGVEYIRGDGLYVLDSLLLFAATVFGAYVGGLALVHAYRYFKNQINLYTTSLIMTVIMLLSAVGVYLGRFGRWNSWQALSQPWDIVQDLYDQLGSSLVRERFVLVILSIFIFQLACVILLNKQGDKGPA